MVKRKRWQKTQEENCTRQEGRNKCVMHSEKLNEENYKGREKKGRCVLREKKGIGKDKKAEK